MREESGEGREVLQARAPTRPISIRRGGEDPSRLGLVIYLQSFSARHGGGQHPETRKSLWFNWRRERDSNPRALSGQRFSRPPPSTSRPSLRGSKGMRAVRRGQVRRAALDGSREGLPDLPRENLGAIRKIRQGHDLFRDRLVTILFVSPLWDACSPFLEDLYFPREGRSGRPPWAARPDTAVSKGSRSSAPS